MNRREALAALVSLPATARISVADVKPNDVIVVECDAPISHEIAKRIRLHVQDVWPNHKVLIVGDGLRIKIASESGGR